MCQNENNFQTPEIISAHRAAEAANRDVADAEFALAQTEHDKGDVAGAELQLAQAQRARTYAYADLGDAWANFRMKRWAEKGSA